MIISVHMPKTAGSSFKHALIDAYGKRFLSDDLDAPLSNSVYHRFKRFKKLFLPLKRDIIESGYDVIHGHFIAPKYNFLPNIKVAIFFRDPIDRLVSHYSFWRRIDFVRSQHKNHSTFAYFKKNQPSIHKFADQKEQRRIYNIFLGNISIERLAFIGLTEAYEDSIKLFSKIFEKDLSSFRDNVNTGQEYRDLLAQARCDLYLKEAQRENQKIYDQAKRKFEKLLRIYSV